MTVEKKSWGHGIHFGDKTDCSSVSSSYHGLASGRNDGGSCVSVWRVIMTDLAGAMESGDFNGNGGPIEPQLLVLKTVRAVISQD